MERIDQPLDQRNNKMSSSDLNLASIIRSIESLPPISAEMRDLFKAASQNIEDIDIDSFVALVEQSPMVAAKLIGLANSAFFRRGRPITSIKEAVIRSIGLRTTCHLTMSLIATSSFDISKCTAFDINAYWLRSLYVAELNKSLCAISKRNLSADTAYLSGLLFNLGELALAHVVPEEYNACLIEVDNRSGLKKLNTEQAHLGIDSTMAGSIISINWALPMVIANVTLHHVTPMYEKDDWEYVLMTHISSEEHTSSEGYRVLPTFLNRLLIDEESFYKALKSAEEKKPKLIALASLLSTAN
jgi:HD-like signal output (HDOD) protein